LTRHREVMVQILAHADDLRSLAYVRVGYLEGCAWKHECTCVE
jgi:hypothetical protein